MSDPTEAQPAVDRHGNVCHVFVPPEVCPDLGRCAVHRDVIPAWLRERIKAGWSDRTRERNEARADLAEAERILAYALHLRMHGERAPGGNETWRTFDTTCERFLRRHSEEVPRG